MNWAIRLGIWLESRRTVSHAEFRKEMSALTKTIEDLKDKSAVPQLIAKELALINVHINQIELWVGLKREPKPEHVPGAPKIS